MFTVRYFIANWMKLQAKEGKETTEKGRLMINWNWGNESLQMTARTSEFLKFQSQNIPRNHVQRLFTIESSLSVKAEKLKFSSTCFGPAWPNLAGKFSSSIIFSRILAISTFENGLGIKRPVFWSRTVSSGPPEAIAITAVPQDMASKGTIPKCSPIGVYKLTSVFWSR